MKSPITENGVITIYNQMPNPNVKVQVSILKITFKLVETLYYTKIIKSIKILIKKFFFRWFIQQK